MMFVYWFLWPLRLVWLLVCCLYKEVYLQIFKCVFFWLHGCCGELEGGPVNQVNHTNRMDVVCCHSIDRPQSVPQPSYNPTLQFSKTFRLNKNGIFHSLVTQFYHLKILSIFKMLYVCNFNVTVVNHLHVVVLDYTAVAVSWKVGPCKPGKPHQLGGVATPTDCPKSVRNCCLIELFCGVVCVVTLPFWHFCWCRGFCHRTRSDLLLFVFAQETLTLLVTWSWPTFDLSMF